jgi:hypothetical protein
MGYEHLCSIRTEWFDKLRGSFRTHGYRWGDILNPRSSMEDGGPKGFDSSLDNFSDDLEVRD